MDEVWFGEGLRRCHIEGIILEKLLKVSMRSSPGYEEQRGRQGSNQLKDEKRIIYPARRRTSSGVSMEYRWFIIACA